jgi:hypothetical protein
MLAPIALFFGLRSLLQEFPVNEPPILEDLGNNRSLKTLRSKNPQGVIAANTNSLLDNRWVVLAAIFFAMMFLGLPLLWRCPNFSRLEKIIWTVIVLLYSAGIIWGFIAIMTWSVRRIVDVV